LPNGPTVITYKFAHSLRGDRHLAKSGSRDEDSDGERHLGTSSSTCVQGSQDSLRRSNRPPVIRSAANMTSSPAKEFIASTSVSYDHLPPRSGLLSDLVLPPLSMLATSPAKRGVILEEKAGPWTIPTPLFHDSSPRVSGRNHSLGLPLLAPRHSKKARPPVVSRFYGHPLPLLATSPSVRRNLTHEHFVRICNHSFLRHVKQLKTDCNSPKLRFLLASTLRNKNRWNGPDLQSACPPSHCTRTPLCVLLLTRYLRMHEFTLFQNIRRAPWACLLHLPAI